MTQPPNFRCAECKRAVHSIYRDDDGEWKCGACVVPEAQYTAQPVKTPTARPQDA